MYNVFPLKVPWPQAAEIAQEAIRSALLHMLPSRVLARDSFELFFDKNKMSRDYVKSTVAKGSILCLNLD